MILPRNRRRGVQRGSVIDERRPAIGGAKRETQPGHRRNAVDGASLSAVRAMIAVVVSMQLGGCSPYVYNQGVATFASNMKAVATANSAGRGALESDMAFLQSQVATREGLPLVTSPPDCHPAALPADSQSFPCTIVLAPEGEKWRKHQAGEQTLVAYERNALDDLSGDSAINQKAIRSLNRAQPLFDTLSRYADALTSLVDAGDAAKLKDATATFATAAGSLVGAADTAVGNDQKTADTASASAAASVAGSLAGAYLDQRRYHVLKSAVSQVDAKFQDKSVARVLSVALDQLTGARLQVLNDKLYIEEEDFRGLPLKVLSPDQYAKKLGTLQSTVDAINALNSVNGSAVVNAMISAHAKLNKAIASGKGQFDAFASTAEDFYTQVTALQKALSDKPSTNG